MSGESFSTQFKTAKLKQAVASTQSTVGFSVSAGGIMGNSVETKSVGVSVESVGESVRNAVGFLVGVAVLEKLIGDGVGKLIGDGVTGLLSLVGVLLGGQR